MAQKKEDVKSLKKQIEWLSKQLSNYNFAIRAGAEADYFLLRQNSILSKLATNTMYFCKLFQDDIAKLDKEFAKRKS